jgi:hypothetical protein
VAELGVYRRWEEFQERMQQQGKQHEIVYEAQGRQAKVQGLESVDPQPNGGR